MRRARRRGPMATRAVVERVSVSKGGKRSLRVTVRAARWWPRSAASARPGREGWRADDGRRAHRYRRSVSRLTDLAGPWPSRTGASKMPRARACSSAPWLPKRESSARGHAASRRACARRGQSSASAVFGPTMGVRGWLVARRSGLGARGHDDEAVGLAGVARDFGDELVDGDTDGGGDPNLGLHPALGCRGDVRADPRRGSSQPPTSR